MSLIAVFHIICAGLHLSIFLGVPVFPHHGNVLVRADELVLDIASDSVMFPISELLIPFKRGKIHLCPSDLDIMEDSFVVLDSLNQRLETSWIENDVHLLGVVSNLR